jgi:cyclic-di-GMP-binding protein
MSIVRAPDKGGAPSGTGIGDGHAVAAAPVRHRDVFGRRLARTASSSYLVAFRIPLPAENMAQQNSFDVSTGADLQEVDNAVNQARKEIATRYDFKGTDCTIDFDPKSGKFTLEADDEYKLTAVYDVLQTKLIRRQVPVRNLKPGAVQDATRGRARQEIELAQGIPTETAKQIVKDVKQKGFKKVQVAIQGDELRVTSPSRDELQAVMAFLREQDYGIELTFGNYR